MGKKSMGMKGALKKYEDSPADRKQHAAGVKEGSAKDKKQDKAGAKKLMGKK
jgi:hypothetical protein